ncbi:MAG: hypothetical protein SchgKO_20910 [Schleiferiaceae bacterium]
MTACQLSSKQDFPESISVELDNGGEITLFKHDGFLELAVDCEILLNLKDHSESYVSLIEKMKLKTWSYDWIFLEYEEDCVRDSDIQNFEILNREVFDGKLKSQFIEGPLIVLEFEKS